MSEEASEKRTEKNPREYPSYFVPLVRYFTYIASISSISGGVYLLASNYQPSPYLFPISLICSGAFLLIIILQRRDLRTLVLRSIVDKEVTTKYLYEVASTIFGVQKNDYNVISYLQPDGSNKGHVQMLVKNVSGSPVSHIDYDYTMLEQDDKKAGEKVKFTELSCMGSGQRQKVEYKKISANQTQCRGTFQFHPAIQKKEKVTLSFTRHSPKDTFVMQVDDEKKHYVEYTSIEIKHPMNMLKMRVVFPGIEYNPVQCRPAVFYGRSKRVVHTSEEHRIYSTDGSWTTGIESETNYFYELNVIYPVMGLTYVILWNPAQKGAEIELSEPDLQSESESSSEVD